MVHVFLQKQIINLISNGTNMIQAQQIDPNRLVLTFKKLLSFLLVSTDRSRRAEEYKRIEKKSNKVTKTEENSRLQHTQKTQAKHSKPFVGKKIVQCKCKTSFAERIPINGRSSSIVL